MVEVELSLEKTLEQVDLESQAGLVVAGALELHSVGDLPGFVEELAQTLLPSFSVHVLASLSKQFDVQLDQTLLQLLAAAFEHLFQRLDRVVDADLSTELLEKRTNHGEVHVVLAVLLALVGRRFFLLNLLLID